MVEMRDAEGHFVVGGRSRDKCVMLDVVRTVDSFHVLAEFCIPSQLLNTLMVIIRRTARSSC